MRFKPVVFLFRDFGGIEITKCISEADMVRIPEKIDGEPVTVIGKRAFVVLEKLEKVIIPGSVKIIGDEAFQNCNNLVRIDIPDNVQSIGSYAFWSCNKMTNVKIGKNVSKIGHSAFGNCVNLTDVIISDSVISIAGHAFTNCRSLKNILIPANVKNIEDGAFGCYVKYEKGKTFTGVIAIFKGKKYNSQLISRIRVIATGEIERELYDLPFTFYNAVNENK